MENGLLNKVTLRLENFEGPFDLLFHLIEKNKMDIYDIKISEITEQYLDFLFTAKQLDMEIASEFLVMATELLHIKSKMLLPKQEEDEEEDSDPRDELVKRLLEYKKYKKASEYLKLQKEKYKGCYYKFPEIYEFKETLELDNASAEVLCRCYVNLLKIKKEKENLNSNNINRLIQYEHYTVKHKIKDIIKVLLKKSQFIFSSLFKPGKNHKLEIVTGFLAVLELAKSEKITATQRKRFSEITIKKKTKNIDSREFDNIDRYK